MAPIPEPIATPPLTPVPSPAGGAAESVSPKNWQVKWELEKWHREADYRAGAAPDEVVLAYDNGLLNAGITVMQNIMIGGSGSLYATYNSDNARIKVGDSATAFSASQSDLQGSSTGLAGMDAAYPQVSGQTATWRATFGSGAGNFVWNEVGVQNGAGAVSATVVLLNRKVQAFGTKAAGSSWTLTLSITVQ